ncbi:MULTISPECIES: GAF and ANTAR domain-containing protein [Prauserella]|uniref:GAF and ANTAR domain-containing protein n=2 Tax=Pseudonocardiaceae TaxID=2070 RepID=A0ABY2S0U6_9PSEU|nr:MULTISPECIES: GAF and ANTAR domain-containing protein [Prauserella]TKG68282.1 GAF and ANTAR domain-containing protein [Prauserella endophytica]TWE14931.1 ANTAR domain-containing protein [Prauserella muralis]
MGQVGDERSSRQAANSEALGQVAHALSEVARSLTAEPDLHQTMKGIVTAAVATIPGAEYAGVSLLEAGQLRTVAPSDDLVARLDELQHELGEGPCVDAIAEHHTYRTGNLADDSRWPKFADTAASLGVASVLGFRLFATSTTLGALNLYSSQRDAFDADAEHIGELFAAHAAVALIGSQEQAQLRTALGTRDVIATAKGILMHRHRRTDAQASTMLPTAGN